MPMIQRESRMSTVGRIRHTMFISVAAAMIFLVMTISASAADVPIAWDPNTETDLAGYNVYYGTTARTGTDPKTCALCGYATKIPLGKVTTYTIANLAQGTTYWISVTAFDTSNNESGFSNEVSGPAKDYIAPVDPKNLKIVP